MSPEICLYLFFPMFPQNLYSLPMGVKKSFKQRLKSFVPGPIKQLVGLIDKKLADLWLRQRRFSGGECLVIGHRGTVDLPENTIESLLKAIADGADGVEFDVVFTRDGVPVVCHDDNVSDRVSPGNRPSLISALSIEQVQRLYIYGGYVVATLSDILSHLAAVKTKRIYVHYKSSNEGRGEEGHHISAISEAVLNPSSTVSDDFS